MTRILEDHFGDDGTLRSHIEESFGEDGVFSERLDEELGEDYERIRAALDRYGEAFRAYRDQHGHDVRVARIFNTYGPLIRLDDGRVILTFIGQVHAGENLTVHGEGEQTRSFCYSSDMIDGLVALMNSGVDEPVNIGTPDERMIMELAELVIELTVSESGIAHEPRPPQDPAVRRPDISKARAKLGWEPTVSLRAGLERTIESFEGLVCLALVRVSS